MTAPADLPLSDDERRTARHFMLLSALATGLFALAIALGFELAAAPASEQAACTTATEERDCGPDATCVRGRCKPLPPIMGVLPCQEGDPCDGSCTCEGAFSCDEQRRCTAAPEDSCSDDVAALLADLHRFEQSQCKRVGEDASQCPPKALDQFFISHRQFDAVLLGLRHTVTVHFDSRQSGVKLPAGQLRAYQEQFAALAERMRKAEQILVIARASEDGRDDQRAQSLNYVIAQNRLDAVARWVVAQESTPAARDAMARKLIRLAIGTSQPLRAELLARNPEHHFVTWSKRQGDRLRAAVLQHKSLPPDDAAGVHRLLNQSVLLVPIPCKLPTRADDPASPL
jgi:hypothetical protein